MSTEQVGEPAEVTEAQLRAVFGLVSDAFVAVDRDWRYAYVNPAAERLIRRPASELVGSVLWDISPRMAEVAGDLLRACMADRQPRTFELDAVEGDRFADVRVHPSSNGLWLLARDVTQERLAQMQARLADERFRLVAAAATDAIYDWDLVSGEVWRSEGITQLFGHESFDGPTVIGRVHPDDRDRVIADKRRFADGSDLRWSGEYRFLRADGAYSVVTEHMTAIRDDHGRAVRLIGGLTDVTADREAEARLNHAQRLEAIGQLTGGVAHDFNNLLTVILGNSEMLIDELDSDDLRSMAEMTREAALRGAELSRRLLAFARRQPLEPRGIDVNRLLGDLEVLLRRALPESIGVEIVRGAGLWPAFVDPGELEAAILNLCLNARDAMPDGGRLTIETANARIDQEYADRHGEVAPGPYVLVAVSDSGVGIAADIVDRVFEPFFTTKGHGAGTGLGLSMVHGFVKQSLGHIKLYSEVDEGTTFRLYLPRAPGVDDPSSSQPAPARRTGSETILVVEDDPMVRELVQAQLFGLGYDVIAVHDGDAALEVIEDRDDLDLLFTDVVMPGGMNGRELARRARDRRPSLLVLYTSGYTEGAIVHHGRLDADAQLLAKPYRIDELARRIRAVLDSTG